MYLKIGSFSSSKKTRQETHKNLKKNENFTRAGLYAITISIQ